MFRPHNMYVQLVLLHTEAFVCTTRTQQNKIALIFIRESSLCFPFAVIFSISGGKERSLFYYVNHFIYKEVIDELSDFCIQMMIPLSRILLPV